MEAAHLANALERLAGSLQKAVDGGFHSRQIDAADLIETLLELARLISEPEPAQ